MKQQGGRRSGHGDHKAESREATPLLADLGITKDQSAKWQKLAVISKEELAARLVRAKNNGTPLTTADFLRSMATGKDARVGGFTGTAPAFSTGRGEWNTPEVIISHVQALFGGEIDLDPCSNGAGTEANVPALKHYTRKDDGLAQRWHGCIYLNPPYGRAIDGWVRKFIGSFAAGDMSQGVALVPARTDTAWFRLFDAAPVCFVSGRLRFSGMQNAAPFPSALFYLGSKTEAFARIFADLGTIYVRYQGA
jgi:phage N-6-adenine-methyltransferase